MDKKLWTPICALLMLAALCACSVLKAPEQYEIAGEAVDSLTRVTGASKVSKIDAHQDTQTQERSYTYAKVEDAPGKMEQYISFLRQEGFSVLEDAIVFGQPSGAGSLGKASAHQGKLFVVAFEYEGDTIVLKVSCQTGELQTWQEQSAQK